MKNPFIYIKGEIALYISRLDLTNKPPKANRKLIQQKKLMHKILNKWDVSSKSSRYVHTESAGTSADTDFHTM